VSKNGRAANARRLKVAGMFAGIGGLELGLQRAGHETAYLCEIDEGARAVLAHHFDGCRITEDVRAPHDLDASFDLLTAGFPCQDLSPAGGTRGIKGSRSRLVEEVLGLLERQPIPWVLIENVPFMLKLDGGAAINLITKRLERIGYRWAYRVLDSQGFGVPQRRLRVFLLASLDGDPREVLLSESHQPVQASYALDEAAHGFYWTEGNRGVGWAENAIPALKGGSGFFIPSPPAVLLTDGNVVTPTIDAAEKLQGFPGGWTRPAVKNGHARRRWTYVGNAVTVNVARWIGERLAFPKSYDAQKDIEWKRNQPWPNAAWFDGHIRAVANTSIWAREYKRKDLEDFLVGSYTPLSGRATAGFLSRLEASRLRASDDFKRALIRHIENIGAMDTLSALRAKRQLIISNETAATCPSSTSMSALQELT